MKKILIVLWLCLGLLSGSCTSETSDEPSVKEGAENINNPAENEDGGEYTPYTEIDLDGSTRAAVGLNNAFAFSLLDKAGTSEDNVAVSPFSLFSVLGMMANGDDGETRAEILSVIGGSGSVSLDAVNAYSRTMLENLPAVDRGSRCDVGNSLWHAPGISLVPSFSTGISGFYNARIFDIDPSGKEGLEKINNWIESGTGGQIKDFLSVPLEGSSALINTLFFKSGWSEGFDREQTWRSDFTCRDGSVVRTEFMHSLRMADYLEDADYEGVDLPLGNGNYSMSFIISKNGNDPALDSRRFESLLAGSRSCDVRLSVPVFETSCRGDIRTALMALGLERTDLNNAAVGMPLFVNTILHGVNFRIDEDGVSGAAVTLGGMATDSGEEAAEEPVVLDFNRPFLFVVRETSTNTILFIGRQNKF